MCLPPVCVWMDGWVAVRAVGWMDGCVCVQVVLWQVDPDKWLTGWVVGWVVVAFLNGRWAS